MRAALLLSSLALALPVGARAEGAPGAAEPRADRKAGPFVERLGEVRVDFSAGTVSVAAAAAADLRAPNAAIARVRAENAARAQAARRIAAALALVSTPRLGCPSRPSKATIDAATARAPAERIEWASDGSVMLHLVVPLADLAAPPPSGPPDAGTPGTPVLLVQVGEEVTWFREEAGQCAVAPRHFETVSAARAAGGELAAATLVLSRQTLVEMQKPVGAPSFAPLPRVVAIARRDDTGVGSSR